MVKNPPASAGDIRDKGSIRGLARSPGGGNGNPFQYFTREISWREETGGLVHGVARVEHNFSN